MENKCLVSDVKDTEIKKGMVLFLGKEVSRKMYEWIMLLTNKNAENNELVKYIFEENNYDLSSTVWEYRRFLVDDDFSKGLINLPTKETLSRFEWNYKNKNSKEDLFMLKDYLQKIFKEIIDIEQVLRLKEINNWTWEKILDEHKKDKYKLLIRMLVEECK